jgi:hypothetical protein
MASGERLLEQMRLGLHDDQNDVDMRHGPAPSPHVPWGNGQLMDPTTGAMVPQKRPYDTAYIDMAIAYDKRFDANPDYQFACEVAGQINVSVEVLQDRVANEHTDALRRQQEKLLVEERKTRLIAFKDRVTELEKLRKERRDIEAVRSRIDRIQAHFQPMVTRWGWLADAKGTFGARPYWLLTRHMFDQYQATRIPSFQTEDKPLFQPVAAQYQWCLDMLDGLSTTVSSLYSLTNAQHRFAVQLYLTLRDSVFASALRLPSAPGPYEGLARTAYLLRKEISEMLLPKNMSSLLFPEVPPASSTQPGANHLTGAGSMILDGLPEPPVRGLFPVLALRVINDRVPNPPAADDVFFGGGVMPAFDALFQALAAGGALPALGFAGLIDLFQATVAKLLLTDARHLELLNGLLTVKHPHVQLAFTGADSLKKLALEYAIFCSTPNPVVQSFTFDLQITNTTILCVVTHQVTRANVLTVTFANLSPATIQAIKALRAEIDKWYANAKVISTERVYNGDRLIAAVLFWSLCASTPAVGKLLSNTIEQLVRIQTPSQHYERIRASFADACVFWKEMEDTTLLIIEDLRTDLNLTTLFYRELFRATFLERYSRANIDTRLLVPASQANPTRLIFTSDVLYNKHVIEISRPLNQTVPIPVLPGTAAPPAPLLLNDSVFFETWEKLYANFFFDNPNEPLGRDNRTGVRPFWRPHVKAFVEMIQLKNRPAMEAIWRAILDRTDERYVTARQRSDSDAPRLKLTDDDDPETTEAVREEEAFRGLLSTTSLEPTDLGPLRLLQSMCIFVRDYHPRSQRDLKQRIDVVTKTQADMVKVLQAALTNDPTLAVEELKKLAAETYIPDARFHMQSQFTGRLKFTPQYTAAVRAAYTDLQNLARLSDQARQVNGYGRRPRPLPYDYSALGGVPMDVLTCNTDPALFAHPHKDAGKPSRDHIDTTATDPGVLTQLRSCMAAMVAQHIFSIRLDAPDEYKSVVQHQRSPQQLKAAQQAMTQFVFDSSSSSTPPVGPRAWRVTFS